MPPKAKTDRNKIVNAAFDLVRECGVQNLSARAIAERLACSTQPVLYHFKTVDEIRAAVIQKADSYHSDYIMRDIEASENPMLAIGSNYIKFGYEEKNLFRLLFQMSNYSGQMTGLFEDDRLLPILAVLSERLSCSTARARCVFITLFAAAHGVASLLANNALEYDEEQSIAILNAAYYGAINSGEGK